MNRMQSIPDSLDQANSFADVFQQKNDLLLQLMLNMSCRRHDADRCRRLSLLWRQRQRLKRHVGLAERHSSQRLPRMTRVACIAAVTAYPATSPSFLLLTLYFLSSICLPCYFL